MKKQLLSLLGTTLQASGTARSRENRRIFRDAELMAARIDLPGGKVDVAPAEGDGKPTKFSGVAYSGGILHLPVGGRKVPVVIDLSTTRIEAGRQYPALRDHDGTKEVGFFVAKIENGMIVKTGTFIDNAHSDQVRANAAKGFQWQASVGMDDVTYEPIKAGASVTVNGKKFTGPLLVARNGLLRESSFVAVGADAETSVSLAASRDCHRENEMKLDPKFVAWLQAGKWGDPEELEGDQLDTLKAAWTQAELKAAGSKQTPFDEEEIIKSLRGKALSETKRIGKIESLKAEFKLGDVEVEVGGAKQKVDFASHAIEAGWSENECELFALRASRTNAPAPRGGHSSKIDTEAIEASLLLASGMSEEEVGKSFVAARREQVMNEAVSEDYRNVGFKGLLRATVHAAGLSAGRFSDDGDSLIDAASRANQKLHAAGQFSTISLPGVLGNVARKTMLQSYDAASLTWRKIAAPISLPDFKTSTRYRLDINGGFTPVGPDGELKHVSLQEADRSIRLETQGAMIGLTRQMIIDDDLNAFTMIPRLFGRQAAIAVEKQVYTVLHAGVDTTLFTTANGNLVEGTVNVLGEAGMIAAMTAFANMVDENGDPVMVDPSTLLVSPALQFKALQLINSTETRNTTASTKEGTANVFKGALNIVMSPYVSNTGVGGTATRYFILSDPDVLPIVEVAFLNGRQRPVIEQERQDFNVLGQLWRAYMDFKAGEGDPHAGVAVTGVAA